MVDWSVVPDSVVEVSNPVVNWSDSVVEVVDWSDSVVEVSKPVVD